MLLAAGAVVIALPDSDDRLFSISRTHGPSALDAAGIATALAGWVILIRVMWWGRSAVRRAGAFPLGVVLFAVGAAVAVVAVALDLGRWWAVGAAVMAAVQAVALGVAANAANSP